MRNAFACRSALRQPRVWGFYHSPGVGYHNHKYFFLFLFYTLIATGRPAQLSILQRFSRIDGDRTTLGQIQWWSQPDSFWLVWAVQGWVFDLRHFGHQRSISTVLSHPHCGAYVYDGPRRGIWSELLCVHAAWCIAVPVWDAEVCPSDNDHRAV